MKEAVDALKRSSANCLQGIASHCQRLETEIVVRERFGAPATILETVDACKADLIVLGTSARHGVRKSIHRVVFASDFSHEADRALQCALFFLKGNTAAELHACHIIGNKERRPLAVFEQSFQTLIEGRVPAATRGRCRAQMPPAFFLESLGALAFNPRREMNGLGREQ